MNERYPKFGLTLQLSQACNLSCSYCYAVGNAYASMSEVMGQQAIDRAVASVVGGGTLELGFFGGEPLLHPERMSALARYAQEQTAKNWLQLELYFTTNGTVQSEAAWELLLDPAFAVSVSHDGLPAVHDRYRRSADGGGTSRIVLDCLDRLLDSGRDPTVIMVVRPDTVRSLPDGITFLWEQGVSRVHPSLDVWARWEQDDLKDLEHVVSQCARLWRDALPEKGIGWFDRKVACVSGVLSTGALRCGFGAGEIAVSPAGNLYPCERLIGTDAPGNPMRLPGSVRRGRDFLNYREPLGSPLTGCTGCDYATACGVTCRCRNYIRTGDVNRPDVLLCTLERACVEALIGSCRNVDARASCPVTPV